MVEKLSQLLDKVLQFLESVQVFLQGGKTYLVGGLMVVIGLYSKDQQLVLEGLGFIALRAGLAKMQ